MSSVKMFLSLLVCFGLLACAPMTPNFVEPKVSLTSFRVLPGESVVPTFEIGLRVINPNNMALKLKGLSYTVELEGYEILTGVSSQLPVIEAYSEGDILLQARPDLFNSVNLFTKLINQPRDVFDFNLSALLDVGGLMPRIRVQKKGQISLQQLDR